MINEFLKQISGVIDAINESNNLKTAVLILFIVAIISIISKRIKNNLKRQEKSHDKGTHGEYLLFKKLSKGFKHEEIHILRNVYVPKADGGTSEIDLLFIHKKGIYVFENKNYSGWIFGDEYADYWTQTLNGGRKGKNKFYNPIKQNRNHIYHLRSYLNISEENLPIFSIIVFGDSCEFKSLKTSGKTPVINLRKVLETVHEISKSFMPVMSEQEVKAIHEKLLPLTQVTQEEKAAHIKSILESQEKADEQKAQGLCPRCGSRLVIRTAHKNKENSKQFLGCSKYPHCKFTMELQTNKERN